MFQAFPIFLCGCSEFRRWPGREQCPHPVAQIHSSDGREQEPQHLGADVIEKLSNKKAVLGLLLFLFSFSLPIWKASIPANS